MTKIAIWSADVGPVHGQGIITEYVSNWVLPNIGTVSNYKYKAGFGFGALMSWVCCVARIWFFCLINKDVVVYVVCSRSTFGFIRDIPILFLSNLGTKVVVHSHGGDIYDLLELRWYSRLAKFLYLNSFLIVSNKPLENQCRISIPNVRTVENYISLDIGRIQENVIKTPFVIGWNSNVMASKGFFTCAEAIRLANEIGHQISFRSIGRLLADDEMSMSELNYNFSEYSKYSWFEYRGPVSQNESIDFIKECHAIALVSKSEAQPFAIIEAMCSGSYVIISDIPALTFTIGSYPASIVKAGEVEGMLQSIIELKKIFIKEGETLRHKLNIGSEEARHRFSRARFSEEIESIFNKVISS